MGEMGRAAVVTAVAIVLSVGALKLASKCASRVPEVVKSYDTPPQKEDPPSHEALRRRGFVGVVINDETVDITPQTEGRLVSVLVRLGQLVHRGDLLVTIDPSPTRRELAATRSHLAYIRAEAMRARLEHKQAAERAVATTSAAKYLNSDELSSALYAEKTASAREEASLAQLAEQAVRVEQLESQLRDCDLRAPTSGVVSDRLLDPGALVDRHSVVVRLISTTAQRVRFAVFEEAAQDLKSGIPIRVESETFSLAQIGHVVAVAPQLDPSSRTLIAEAVLDLGQPDLDRFTPGSVVRVFLTQSPGAARNPQGMRRE